MNAQAVLMAFILTMENAKIVKDVLFVVMLILVYLVFLERFSNLENV